MFRSSFFYFFLSSLLLNSFFPFPFEQYLCSKDSPKDYWDIDIPHEDLYCKLDIEGSSFSSIINLKITIIRIVGYMILGKVVMELGKIVFLLLFTAINFSLFLLAIIKLEDQIEQNLGLEKEINNLKLVAGKSIQELNTTTQKFNEVESKIKVYEGDNNVLMNLSIHFVLEMEMKLQSNIQKIAEFKTKVLQKLKYIINFE